MYLVEAGVLQREGNIIQSKDGVVGDLVEAFGLSRDNYESKVGEVCVGPEFFEYIEQYLFFVGAGTACYPEFFVFDVEYNVIFG